MVAVTDLKAWSPDSFLKKGELFQFGGNPYKVLADHKTGKTFSANNSNVTVYYGATGGGGGSGGDGRGITSAQVDNNGHLIVSYTDSTTEDAGEVVGADGADGAAGPTGAKGDKGDTGDEGPQGPAGEQGIQGEVGSTGAQGDPGVKGDTGAQGPAGAKGDKGDTGDTGAQGPAGADGAKGDKGDTGSQGTQGPAGPAGSTGATGAAGPTTVPDEYGTFDEAKVISISGGGVDYNLLIISGGDQRVDKTQPAALNGDMSGHLVRWENSSTSWKDLGPIVGVAGPAGAMGAQGPQGEQGPKGDTGDKGDTGATGTAGLQGNTGAQGSPGESAYQVAVDNGFVGTQAQWLASLVGAQGSKGDTGAQGTTGATGTQGPTGATGSTGAQGAPGVVPKTTIVTHTDTAYTLALTDAEKYCRFSAVAAKTVTLPTNATVAFPWTAEGETTTLIIDNPGAGLLTIAPASGVTINLKQFLSLTIAQFGTALLTKVGTDLWDITGDLEQLS